MHQYSDDYRREQTPLHVLPIGSRVFVQSSWNPKFFLNGSICEIIDYIVNRHGYPMYTVKMIEVHECKGSGKSMIGITREVKLDSVHLLANKAYKHMLRK